jgi:hypothetical protein
MALVVALSSILFWLPLGALSERAIFGGLLFLAMVVLGVTAQIGTPQVMYGLSKKIIMLSYVLIFTLA